MKILCAVGIHRWNIQWRKSRQWNGVYETRTCQCCGWYQLKQLGGRGDGKWHDVEKNNWGYRSEKEQFFDSFPIPNPSEWGYDTGNLKKYPI